MSDSRDGWVGEQLDTLVRDIKPSSDPPVQPAPRSIRRTAFVVLGAVAVGCFAALVALAGVRFGSAGRHSPAAVATYREYDDPAGWHLRYPTQWKLRRYANSCGGTQGWAGALVSSMPAPSAPQLEAGCGCHAWGTQQLKHDFVGVSFASVPIGFPVEGRDTVFPLEVDPSVFARSSNSSGSGEWQPVLEFPAHVEGRRYVTHSRTSFRVSLFRR